MSDESEPKPPEETTVRVGDGKVEVMPTQKSEPRQLTEDEKQNAVQLDFHRMFCPLHGELFRERWPTGALLFQVKGIHDLLARKEFGDECVSIDSENFKAACEAALDVEPMCCRIARIMGPNALVQLYEYSGLNHPEGNPLFKPGPCGICRKQRPGGPMMFHYANCSQRVPHVCIRCVVTKLKADPRDREQQREKNRNG